jgi:hypothetical protein
MRLPIVAIIALAAAGFAQSASAAPAKPTQCVFRAAPGRLDGGCGPIFDRHPAFSIAAQPALTSGVWRPDRAPSATWGGQMIEAGYPISRAELEIYPDHTGVLRTSEGWYAVSGFSADKTRLRFRLDATKEIEPGALDRRIIERAAAILSNEAVWNRADTRDCAADATTWSAYCALRRATVEVTGGFHHRRPALELVRAVVRERAAGRGYEHGLMDYNNDPATRLADVQSAFAEALRRIPR